MSAVAGRGLGLVFGGLAHLRPKPLHPKGDVSRGTLVRTGSAGTWGVPWLDEPGQSPALVRVSRSVGLPDALPDVLGLALRVDGGDLLLASSLPPVGLRHVFVPRRDPHSAFFSSAFTYSTPAGPAVLGAQPSGEGWELLVASPRGEWSAFGRLAVTEEPGDEPVSFDPVLRPLPGLPLSPQLAALREPSYAAARRRRAVTAAS